MDATTSDSPSGGGTAGRKGPAARPSAAAKQSADEKDLREEELRHQLDEAVYLVSRLQDQLLESQSREEDCRSRVERLEAVVDAEKQKYESLMREVILTSAIDGLSTSLQNLDTTLGTKLAPLAVLNTLTSAGPDVGAVDVGRFAAVQGATARISSDYVVRRAEIVQPGTSAATSSSAP